MAAAVRGLTINQRAGTCATDAAPASPARPCAQLGRGIGGGSCACCANGASCAAPEASCCTCNCTVCPSNARQRGGSSMARFCSTSRKRSLRTSTSADTICPSNKPRARATSACTIGSLTSMGKGTARPTAETCSEVSNKRRYLGKRTQCRRAWASLPVATAGLGPPSVATPGTRNTTPAFR